MNIRLAKVVKVHPQHRSADLVYLDTGWHVSGAQVLAHSGSSSHGSFDLPAPIVDEANPWDTAMLGQRDMLAVVAEVGTVPVVLGFLMPQVSQMMFEEPNLRVDRHVSDVYSTINDAGDVTLQHPSGSYLHLGQGEAVSLDGKDFDQEWKITRNSADASFTLSINGGKATISIAANGAMEFTSETSIKLTAPRIDLNDMAAVARIGDACAFGHIVGGSGDVFANGIGVARLGDGTTCGAVLSGSGTVYANGAPLARIGDATTCGPIVAGSGDVFAG